MPRKQLISSDEAIEAKGQHTKPCSDCPWARTSLRGWLGSMTSQDWLEVAHGEARVDCHALKGAQCAGIAIYQANVGKRPRNPSTLRLPADREAVFASPPEFLEHHRITGGPVRSPAAPTCHFCPKPGTDDNFCHGCKVYVCDDCGVNLGLMGRHAPEDHLESDEED